MEIKRIVLSVYCLHSLLSRSIEHFGGLIDCIVHFLLEVSSGGISTCYFVFLVCIVVVGREEKIMLASE